MMPGRMCFPFDVDFLLALRELIVGADGDEFFVADRHAAFESFGRV